MTRPPDSCAPGPDRRNAWETGSLGWDFFYLLVFAAVLMIVLASTPGSKAVAGAAMGAMIAWYLFVGRPLWTGGRTGPVRAAIYVIGLFALFGVAQSQNPDVWFLAFAISPQFFSFLDIRLAMGLGIALNFLAAVLLVYRYPGWQPKRSRSRPLAAASACSTAPGCHGSSTRAPSAPGSSTSSRPPGLSWRPRSTRPDGWPSGSGSPPISTTRWRRASPASSC